MSDAKVSAPIAYLIWWGCPTCVLGLTRHTSSLAPNCAVAHPPNYRLAKPRRISRLWLEHEKRYLSNQEIDVQKLLLPMIGILTAVLASGCNSAKSPAAVATDVAAARQQASTEVADSRKDAAKNVDSAAANVDGSSKDLNDANAKAAYDVAVAQADGDHNVAIQQCSALTGDAQKSCKERADAGYDQAKTHANVARLSKLQ
jgi:hypothetical protein